MKKLTKILATVLTVALAASTVVMPVSAAAIADSDKLVWDDPITIGTTPGNNGKDASDVVKAVSAQWRIYGYGANFENVGSDVVTYETQMCLPLGSKAKFLVWNGTADESRTTINFEEGRIMYSTDTDTSSFTTGNTGYTYNNNQWYKVAIERTSTGWNMYVDGTKVATRTGAYAGGGKYTKDFGFDSISGTVYVDNIRVYKGAYAPNRDVMPADGVAETLIEGTQTVAQVKTALMAGQDATKAEVRVYKDAIGGTQAADTDYIKAGWKAVITSLSGDLYKDVYTVQSAVAVSSVTYDENTVTATVANNSGSTISSMMMVLVQDGGKIVMSSAVQTNVGATATFTISGVDSLSTPEIFFVKSWEDLTPVVDNITPVE